MTDQIDPEGAIEQDGSYRPATRGDYAFTFAVVGVAFAALGWMAFANAPEQSLDEWVANAPVVEQGLDDLYVEDVTVLREFTYSGRSQGGDETILVDGEPVDCKVFADDALDLRCKTDDGVLPLTPEP